MRLLQFVGLIIYKMAVVQVTKAYLNPPNRGKNEDLDGSRNASYA